MLASYSHHLKVFNNRLQYILACFSDRVLCYSDFCCCYSFHKDRFFYPNLLLFGMFFRRVQYNCWFPNYVPILDYLAFDIKDSFNSHYLHFTNFVSAVLLKLLGPGFFCFGFTVSIIFHTTQLSYKCYRLSPIYPVEITSFQR